MRLTVKRSGVGYVGAVSVPLHNVDGHMVVRARGSTKARALRNAALVAERIVEDPAIAAMAPNSAPDVLASVGALALASEVGIGALYSTAETRRERQIADVFGHEIASVGGWTDTFKSIAKAGWKVAKQHRAKIVAAAATAALGPAGGAAALKAMSMLDGVKKNNPEAVRALKQVARAARGGNKKAQLMLDVVKVEAAAEKREQTPADPPSEPVETFDESTSEAPTEPTSDESTEVTP